MMGYSVLRVTTPDTGAKALELAAGRVFASGRGFCHSARRPPKRRYKRSWGIRTAAAPEPKPEPEIAVAGPAASWADIDVGNLLLAAVEGDDQWWPSLVAEARGEGIFVLRWVGYPDEPAFVRRREALGLLPPLLVAPEAGAGAPVDPAA